MTSARARKSRRSDVGALGLWVTGWGPLPSSALPLDPAAHGAARGACRRVQREVRENRSVNASKALKPPGDSATQCPSNPAPQFPAPRHPQAHSRLIHRPHLRPRSAACDAPGCFRAADPESVFRDRSAPVRGARRCETAEHASAQVRRHVRAIRIDRVERRLPAEPLQRDRERDGDQPRSAAFASSHNASISSSVNWSILRPLS